MTAFAVPEVAGAPVLRCPTCRAPFAGPVPERCACGHGIEWIGSIPVLVRDAVAVRTLLADRMSEAGRAEWYRGEQSPQLVGPFRHHMKRRIAYVSGILESTAVEWGRRPTILDLGCGDGVNLHWLREHAEALFGSDYNPVRLERAATVPGVAQLFMADVTDYPADDESFEIVFFNHVLEHIDDDMAALREVRRIVRRYGRVILGVPNEGALFWRIAYGLQPASRRSSDHVHFYTAETISARCRDAGFAVESVHHIGYGVPHWSLDARLRSHGWVEAAFERLGRTVAPSQATSLYLVLRRAGDRPHS